MIHLLYILGHTHAIFAHRGFLFVYFGNEHGLCLYMHTFLMACMSLCHISIMLCLCVLINHLVRACLGQYLENGVSLLYLSKRQGKEISLIWKARYFKGSLRHY